MLASSPSWQYGRGRVSMMATVMVPSQAIEHIYGVARGAVTLDAELE